MNRKLTQNANRGRRYPNGLSMRNGNTRKVRHASHYSTQNWMRPSVLVGSKYVVGDRILASTRWVQVEV